MADVLQGGRVDLAPAGRIAQAALCDEGRRHLGRHRMQQVEALGGADRLAVRVLALEPGRARGAVDGHQRGAEGQPGAVAFHVAHQPRHEGFDTEQRGAGQIEFHVDVIEHAGASPVVAGQVHRFLRRAGAFDRHGRLREQRAPRAQAAHQRPGVGGQVEAVVGGDAVLPQRGFQALDALPGQPQAGADDQLAVPHAVPVVEGHAMGGGIDMHGAGADAAHVCRDQRVGLPHGAAGVEYAAADQRPGRLVVVGIARLDDRDVELRPAAAQARGHADAGGTATDDQDFGGRMPRRIRAGGGGHSGFALRGQSVRPVLR